MHCKSKFLLQNSGMILLGGRGSYAQGAEIRRPSPTKAFLLKGTSDENKHAQNLTMSYPSRHCCFSLKQGAVGPSSTLKDEIVATKKFEET